MTQLRFNTWLFNLHNRINTGYAVSITNRDGGIYRAPNDINRANEFRISIPCIPCEPFLVRAKKIIIRERNNKQKLCKLLGRGSTPGSAGKWGEWLDVRFVTPHKIKHEV